jgi:predicted transcriptional regulator
MARVNRRDLSRRERQIMDLIYRLGEATASEIQENLHDAPSYSAVRSHLRILEEKGQLRHRQEGQRYVFLPTVSRDKARTDALSGLLNTFFEGSREQMVASLIDEKRLSKEELARLAELIDSAQKEGR